MSDAPEQTDLTCKNPINPAELSVKQEIAMLALFEGHTQRRAAEIAGVNEATLSRWLDDDQAFYQVFVTRKSDIFKRFESRIVALADKALTAIDWALNGEAYHAKDGPWRVSDQLHAAELALKMAGLLKPANRVAVFGGQLNMAQQQVNTTGDIKR